MQVRELELREEEGLALDREILTEAGLTGRLRLIVREGEIRILPLGAQDPDEVLQELAGILGHEPAEAYDFHLEIGGAYEAR